MSSISAGLGGSEMAEMLDLQTTTFCFSRKESVVRYRKYIEGVGLASFCLFGHGDLRARASSEVSFV